MIKTDIWKIYYKICVKLGSSQSLVKLNVVHGLKKKQIGKDNNTYFVICTQYLAISYLINEECGQRNKWNFILKFLPYGDFVV